MRVKFRVEPDNTVTVLQEDQEDTTISIENDGDDKIIIVYGTEEQPIDFRLPQGVEE